MAKIILNNAAPKRARRGRAEPADMLEQLSHRAAAKQAIVDRLSEPSTWMGILTIAATFATGGLASWLNAGTLPAIGAGLGLILTKDGD